MLGGVGHASAVVFLEPLFQVLGDTDVSVFAVLRLEDVDVVEF